MIPALPQRNRQPIKRPAKVRVNIDPTSGMNRTEARYAAHLQVRLLAGELLEWRFEALKLRLARATFYTPDFVLITTLGEIECHDVKGKTGSGYGGWTDDARVKIKVAAAAFAWLDFVGAAWLSKRQGGPGWKFETFPPG